MFMLVVLPFSIALFCWCVTQFVARWTDIMCGE